MAMRAVLGLIKFENFRNDLDVPTYAALGILEALWHITAANAVRGDIGRFSNQEIANRIGWKGNADHLVSALVKAHWLDLHSKHRLIVHDWHVHADRWIKSKAIRNGGFAHNDPSEVIDSLDTPKDDNGSNGASSATLHAHAMRTPGTKSGTGPETGPESSARAQSPRAEEQIEFQSLPKQLDTPEFRKAWLEWEEYFRGLRGVMQPLTRCNVFASLLKFGPSEAIKRIELTMEKQARNIITGELGPLHGSKPQPPPARKYKNATEIRLAAEKLAGEMEREGIGKADILEELTRKFGSDLPSTIIAKLKAKVA